MLTKAEKTVGFGSILMPQLFGSFYTSHCLYNSALLSRVKLSSYLPPKEVEIQTKKRVFSLHYGFIYDVFVRGQMGEDHI